MYVCTCAPKFGEKELECRRIQTANTQQDPGILHHCKYCTNVFILVQIYRLFPSFVNYTGVPCHICTSWIALSHLYIVDCPCISYCLPCGIAFLHSQSCALVICTRISSISCLHIPLVYRLFHTFAHSSCISSISYVCTFVLLSSISCLYIRLVYRIFLYMVRDPPPMDRQPRCRAQGHRLGTESARTAFQQHAPQQCWRAAARYAQTCRRQRQRAQRQEHRPTALV